MLSDGQIVMFIVGVIALWYLLGRETCTGCVDECRVKGGNKVDCQNQCFKKGICPMGVDVPTTPSIPVAPPKPPTPTPAPPNHSSGPSPMLKGYERDERSWL